MAFHVRFLNDLEKINEIPKTLRRLEDNVRAVGRLSPRFELSETENGNHLVPFRLSMQSSKDDENQLYAGMSSLQMRLTTIG